jgi:excisionase family DNA binding protein
MIWVRDAGESHGLFQLKMERPMPVSTYRGLWTHRELPQMSSVSGVVKKSFCTTREAATLLGVSVGTVQLWVENGLLQAWKTAGGHRRVMRDSIAR